MFISKVREVMQDRGKTVKALVEASGLAKETINRARSPLIGRCTLETLATIAKALGCQVKDLFEEASE